jgi:hypothetical protein
MRDNMSEAANEKKEEKDTEEEKKRERNHTGIQRKQSGNPNQVQTATRLFVQRLFVGSSRKPPLLMRCLVPDNA